MFEVRVESHFCAAHFLKDYKGKCENLHGHNYKVFVHVKGSTLDEGGMLLDFTDLKKAVKSVCDTMDHTNLNDNEFFKQNPSAERIALYIYKCLLEKLPFLNQENSPSETSQRKIFISAVDVFETDTNRARYIPD